MRQRRSLAPAAENALDVLALLSRQAGPIPAGRIATELGLARSTTYRLLDVLIGRGYVVHLPDQRRYSLGVAAFELGSAYSRQGALQRAARPLLANLSASCEQNAHLAILHGVDVLYLIEQRFPGRPSLVTDVGVRLPAPLTASGLAILAALPTAQVRAVFGGPDVFVQRNGLGPLSLSGLRALLVDTRRRGYALELGTITPGLSSVAVPVHDHASYPIAAITVTFDASDSAVVPPDLAGSVRQSARELSRRLGHRYPGIDG